MSIVWLPEARGDVARVHAYLMERSPRAAARAARLLREAAEVLDRHPHAGRRMDDDTERRELVMPFGAGAYVLRYRLSGQDVVVIRVWHNREARL